MNDKIKPILTFVLSSLKVKPRKTESNNGFMIFSPVSPADLQKLKSLCESAGWSAHTFKAGFDPETGVATGGDTWFGIKSAEKELGIDELMTQASQITPKS